MSPDLERLIRLQELDTAIATARSRIATHPRRLAEGDDRLSNARRRLDEVRQRLKENQEVRRALEKDAAMYQTRLSKFKDQLSAVKTNREYQAMQVEIETAQKELGGAEERVLERMLDGDVLAADLKDAETALAASQKEVEAEKRLLTEELSTLEASLRDALEARGALISESNPHLVALFEHVARSRKGVALCVATREGLCSVCHVRLRPPVFQQVRHNDSVVQCESCQRILYYVPPPPPVEPPVTHAP